MFSVSLQTLGCKLNQLETESIADAFRKQGYSIMSWPGAADLFIVNTCTVTSKAEQKARRIIRKVLKDNPGACLIATGCYAQLEPALLESLSSEHRIFSVAGDFKDVLLDLPKYLAERACSSADLPEILRDWALPYRDPAAASNTGTKNPNTGRFRFDVNDFSFHSRASLKIQDGCDNHCAYCRVRIARGRSRSLDAPVILSRLQELERRSYNEAVLTGININQYRSESMNFTDLLKFLIDGTERIGIRISSTEPDAVNEEFAALASDKRIRAHFHLSVQSGSDVILQRMRRSYTADQVLRAVSLLRSAKDDPFIAADIITGFPGETEQDFAQTFALCKEAEFAWIHAFPFSPRPGTEAARMDGRVSEHTSGERVERLIKLAESGRKKYLQGWLGRKVHAVAERTMAQGENNTEAGFYIINAVSENYIKLAVHVPETTVIHPGAQIYCRIEKPAAAADLHCDAIGKLVYP